MRYIGEAVQNVLSASSCTVAVLLRIRRLLWMGADSAETFRTNKHKTRLERS